MRSCSLVNLENHLLHAPMAPVYIVIVACPYERKKIIESIVTTLKKKEPALDFYTEEGEECALMEALENLNTHSLFGEKRALYLNGIEKLKQDKMRLIVHYLSNPSPFAHLFLGAAKPMGELLSSAKDNFVICDLSGEKPWERKERLRRVLLQHAQKNGKSLLPQTLELLFEYSGLDLGRLEQELNKLFSYVGERTEITPKDVQALCVPQHALTIWQLVDSVLYKGEKKGVKEPIDLALFLPFLGHLRAHLQLGLAATELMAQGFNAQAITKYLTPFAKRIPIDKLLPFAQKRGESFFIDNLHHVFEVELLAKSSQTTPELLLDLLIAKLTQI